MKNDHLWLNAPAKVNLLLDVKRKLPDGYHELEGIMQSVSVCDTVGVRRAAGISVKSSLPLPADNTCIRAAEAFLSGSGLGAEIIVNKRIPSEAGMGGASADAAAVLIGLNELSRGTELFRTDEELMKLGLSVGADVPFCLNGGTAIARGVGEKLDPLPHSELHLLIVRGSRGVSTGKLFASLGVGSEKKSRLPDGALSRAVNAIEAGDAAATAAEVGNALTEAAVKEAPEIAGYIERMLASGALGASMTGSGAAVFGIFPSRRSAEEAKAAFAGCGFAEVCRALPQTPEGRPSVCFVPAKESDASVITALRRRIWADVYRGIYPDEAISAYETEYHLARDRERILSPHYHVFTVRDGEKPVGYLYFEDNGRVHAQSLYLLSPYRGLGIGRAAFDVMRTYCRENGYRKLTCCCNAHNLPALAFYERMGGREISRSVGHENRQEDQIGLVFEV